MTAASLIGMLQRLQKDTVRKQKEWMASEKRRLTDHTVAESRPFNGSEYPLRVLLGTLGRRIMVSTADRLTRYLGLERSSLSMYVLAAYARGSAYSTEAGLKYYRVGVVGSSRRLYGMTMIYATYGSTDRNDMQLRAANLSAEATTSETRWRRIGSSRLRSVFRIKLGVVPMHRWVADVYEGAPSGSALYFAIIGKIPMLRVRIQLSFRIKQQEGRTLLLQLMAMATMTVGALTALVQYRWKRRLAYSGIRNVGQMLIPMRVGTVEASHGMLVYRTMYRRMTIVAWISRRSRTMSDREVKYRPERTGRGKESSVFALTIRLRSMSRAGVPPLGGFLGKRLVYNEAIAAEFYRRAMTGVIMGVVGAFNYLRLAKVSRFDQFDPTTVKAHGVVEANRTKEESYIIASAMVLRRSRLVSPMGLMDRAMRISRDRIA
jgi:NADH-quinone oxidoreductase subunit N